MGATAYWDYGADQRISTVDGLAEIVMGPIQVGDTISFARLRSSGSRSSKEHHFTIEGLGIDILLDSGAADELLKIELDKAGTFLIDDSSDPGAHGVVKIIVEGGPSLTPTPTA